MVCRTVDLLGKYSTGLLVVAAGDTLGFTACEPTGVIVTGQTLTLVRNNEDRGVLRTEVFSVAAGGLRNTV